MNNTFNINRFGLLLKRQWLDFGKVYLISLLVVVGALVGFYFYYIPSPFKENNFDYDGNLDMRFRYPIYLILGFLFISIVASSYFSLLGQKSRAILELMTPASTFEKFLSGVFYTTLVSFASYIILFYLIDLSFVKYLNMHLGEFKNTSKASSTLTVDGFFDQILSDKKYREYCAAFFGLPFLITSIFLLGSVYFKNFHYIKTTVSTMLFSAICIYVIYNVGDLLTRNMTRKDPVGNIDNEILLSIFLTGTVLTLIFWLITYVRLKEKEV
ncbi:hypothetical protein [Pedobacter sp. Leaf250]|uniref:hypothetical protein n=1 Tax=Pedobacter sp. Leaf250 TaxID=2876559 RepID=UPI001E413F53|nr:hypothetical protein [Pedobacter sp. Leaf250]